MRFKIFKQPLVSLVRSTTITVFVSALATTLVFSPVAFALEIKLGSAMRVRTVDENDLVSVGILAAGSVVEIPDRYKVMGRNGRIDDKATLKKWLTDAGYSRKDASRAITDPRKDFYYPVRIKKVAAGSSGKELKGSTLFMALRVLARSKGGMTVTKTTRAFASRKDQVPLDARGEDTRNTPPAVATQPSRSSENAEKTQDDPSTPDYTREQESAPKTDDDQTEATGSKEDCPDCDAAADAVTSAARSAQDSAFNASAYGKQGLTSQFNPACSKLIKSDGTYGSWGQTLVKQLNRHKDDFTAPMSASAASRVCPNFNRFDDAEKIHFWAYLTTAVIAGESDCDATQRARGPDGKLAGLGQMPASQTRNNNDDSFYHWGNDCSGSMFNPTNNIRCTVRRLDAMIRDGNGPYQRGGNYWSTLRDEPHGMTKALISQYEACGAREFDVPRNRAPSGATRVDGSSFTHGGHARGHKHSKKHRRNL